MFEFETEKVNTEVRKITLIITLFYFSSGVSAFDNCPITGGLFASRETCHSAWKKVLWKQLAWSSQIAQQADDSPFISWTNRFVNHYLTSFNSNIITYVNKINSRNSAKF